MDKLQAKDFVASQLPDFIVSENPLFVKFLEYYYAWLETQSQPYIDCLVELKDIDSDTKVLNDHTIQQILGLIPANALRDQDRDLVVKHIKSFFLSKGTKDSFEFIFNLLLNKVVSCSINPTSDVNIAKIIALSGSFSRVNVSDSLNGDGLINAKVQDKISDTELLIDAAQVSDYLPDTVVICGSAYFDMDWHHKYVLRASANEWDEDTYLMVKSTQDLSDISGCMITQYSPTEASIKCIDSKKIFMSSEYVQEIWRVTVDPKTEVGTLDKNDGKIKILPKDIGRDWFEISEKFDIDTVRTKNTVVVVNISGTQGYDKYQNFANLILKQVNNPSFSGLIKTGKIEVDVVGNRKIVFTLNNSTGNLDIKRYPPVYIVSDEIASTCFTSENYLYGEIQPSISELNITTNSPGYSIGEKISLVGDGTSVAFTIDAVTSGSVETVEVLQAGSHYEVGDIVEVDPDRINKDGSGFSAVVSNVNGKDAEFTTTSKLTNVILKSSDVGFLVNDKLTLQGGSFTKPAILNVSSVSAPSNPVIHNIKITNPGSGYGYPKIWMTPGDVVSEVANFKAQAYVYTGGEVETQYAEEGYVERLRTGSIYDIKVLKQPTLASSVTYKIRVDGYGATASVSTALYPSSVIMTSTSLSYPRSTLPVSYALTWRTGEVVASGIYRRVAHKLYKSTTSGTCGVTEPSHTVGSVSDGAVTWAAAGTAGTGYAYTATPENWVSTKAYVIGDHVMVSGIRYIAVANNTNKNPPSFSSEYQFSVGTATPNTNYAWKTVTAPNRGWVINKVTINTIGSAITSGSSIQAELSNVWKPTTRSQYNTIATNYVSGSNRVYISITSGTTGSAPPTSLSNTAMVGDAATGVLWKYVGPASSTDTTTAWATGVSVGAGMPRKSSGSIFISVTSGTTGSTAPIMPELPVGYMPYVTASSTVGSVSSSLQSLAYSEEAKYLSDNPNCVFWQYLGVAPTFNVTTRSELGSINVVTSGLNYVDPVVEIISPTGSGASAKAQKDIYGRITNIILQNIGQGYITPPSIVIKERYGQDATFDVNYESSTSSKVTGLTIFDSGIYTDFPNCFNTLATTISGKTVKLDVAFGLNTLYLKNAGTMYNTPALHYNGNGEGAVLLPHYQTGVIESLTVNSGGSGYDDTTKVYIKEVEESSGRSVGSFNIVDGGSGYESNSTTISIGTKWSAQEAVPRFSQRYLGSYLYESVNDVPITESTTPTHTTIGTIVGNWLCVGETATVSAFTAVDGAITVIQLGNVGSGYSTAPAVSIGTPWTSYEALNCGDIRYNNGQQYKVVGYENSGFVANYSGTHTCGGYPPNHISDGINDTQLEASEVIYWQHIGRVASIFSVLNRSTGSSFTPVIGKSIKSLGISYFGSGYTDTSRVVIGTSWSSGISKVIGDQVFYDNYVFTAVSAGTTGIFPPLTTIIGQQWNDGGVIWECAGEKAKAIVTGLSGSAVSTFSITGGSGYTTTPTVKVYNSAAVESGVFVANTSGYIYSVSGITGGSGYNYAPNVSLSGGGGTLATIVATVFNDQVSSIAVTSGGTNYATNPTVVFGTAWSSGASYTPTIPTAYDATEHRTNAGKHYKRIYGATSGTTAPTHTTGRKADSTSVLWGFDGADIWADGTTIYAGSVVRNGRYLYTAINSGTAGGEGIAQAPTHTSGVSNDSDDGTGIIWEYSGDTYLLSSYTAYANGQTISIGDLRKNGNNVYVARTSGTTANAPVHSDYLTVALGDTILWSHIFIVWTTAETISSYEQVYRINDGNLYKCGSNGTTGAVAPTHTSGLALDAATGVVWEYKGTVAVASTVTRKYGITNIGITSGGTSHSAALPLSFTGDGSGAAGYAFTETGKIESVVLTNAGSNYTVEPTVGISGSAIISCELNDTGVIKSVVVNDGGYEYNGTEEIKVDGTGLGADIAFNTIKTNVLGKIDVLNGGSGYWANTTITHTGATLLTSLDNGTISGVKVVSSNQNITPVSIVINGSVEPTATVAINSEQSQITSITINKSNTPFQNYGFSSTDTPTKIEIDGNSIDNVLIPTIDAGQIAKVEVKRANRYYSSVPTIQVVGSGAGAVLGLELTNVTSGYIKRVVVTQRGQNYAIGVSAYVDGTFVSRTSSAGCSITPVINRGISRIKIVSGGLGYRKPPKVTVTSGSGSGAVLESVLDAYGKVKDIIIKATGVNYITPPTIDIEPSPSGGLATAIALLDYPIEGFTINSAGSGYTNANIVVIGPSGSNFDSSLATVQITKYGGINQPTLLTSGSGFVINPTVSITDSGSPGNITEITILNKGKGYSTLPPLRVRRITNTNGVITTRPEYLGEEATVRAVSTTIGKVLSVSPTSNLTNVARYAEYVALPTNIQLRWNGNSFYNKNVLVSGNFPNEAGAFTQNEKVTIKSAYSDYTVKYGIVCENNDPITLTSGTGDFSGVAVNKISLLTKGYGYTNIPKVTIGTEWEDNLTVLSGDQIFYGKNLYTILNDGYLGQTPPTHDFGVVDIDGMLYKQVGIAAKATAIVEYNENPLYELSVVGIEIIQYGSGYTSPPSVKIDDPSGTYRRAPIIDVTSADFNYDHLTTEWKESKAKQYRVAYASNDGNLKLVDGINHLLDTSNLTFLSTEDGFDIIDEYSSGQMSAGDIIVGDNSQKFAVIEHISVAYALPKLTKFSKSGFTFTSYAGSLSNNKIRTGDNDRWQDFAYAVKSFYPGTAYRDILEDTVHMVGYKMFCDTLYESKVNAQMKLPDQGGGTTDARLTMSLYSMSEAWKLTETYDEFSGSTRDPIYTTSDNAKHIRDIQQYFSVADKVDYQRNFGSKYVGPALSTVDIPTWVRWDNTFTTWTAGAITSGSFRKYRGNLYRCNTTGNSTVSPKHTCDEFGVNQTVSGVDGISWYFVSPTYDAFLPITSSESNANSIYIRPISYNGNGTRIVDIDTMSIGDADFNATTNAFFHYKSASPTAVNINRVWSSNSDFLDGDKCKYSGRIYFAVTGGKTGSVGPSGLVVDGNEIDPENPGIVWKYVGVAPVTGDTFTPV